MKDTNLDTPIDVSESLAAAEADRAFRRRMVWVVFASALAVVTLLVIAGRAELGQAGTVFLEVLVYSFFISVLSAGILRPAAPRIMARYARAGVFVFIAILFGTTAAGCLLAGAVLLAAGVVSIGGFWEQFWLAFRFGIVVALAFGLGVTFYESMRHRLAAAELELRSRQLEQERANTLLAQAKLASLEARIHPHFLFNTLNSIASLIPSDPQRAEALVGKLSSMLRFSLHAARSSLVPLGQEVNVVRDYLEIEKARLADRLRVHTEVSEEFAQAQVPPLCLQSLVENSVKYAVAPRPQGGTIEVRASAEHGLLKLEVSDDGPGFSLAAAAPGHGLRSLEERLRILFGHAGRLEVGREGARTVVRLSIPVDNVNAEENNGSRAVSSLPGGR